MSEQDLDAVRGDLADLPFDAVVQPSTPPDILAHEATQLLKLLEKPEVAKAMIGIGLSAERLAKLPRYIGALDAAQDQWLLVFGRSKTPERKQREREAVALRRELLAVARWVLRDDTFAEATLDFIEQGDGMADMVEDLRALAALVRDRAPAFAMLKDVNALALADKASLLAAELREMLVSAGRTETRMEAKNQRDRAYTLLSALVKELYAAGRFAYRHDPNMAALFRSLYGTRRRSRSSSPLQEPVTSDNPAAPGGEASLTPKGVPGSGIVV